MCRQMLKLTALQRAICTAECHKMPHPHKHASLDALQGLLLQSCSSSGPIHEGQPPPFLPPCPQPPRLCRRVSMHTWFAKSGWLDLAASPGRCLAVPFLMVTESAPPLSKVTNRAFSGWPVKCATSSGEAPRLAASTSASATLWNVTCKSRLI